ncbi:ORF48 [Leucania separata nucleopolyhedrovirus]|uniref:ORF48 n=1 Tax=Leucania separata nucleopolyhedrovirus TaxID=1307956 RepID=Q0IL71_NPVLS|nr:ORF48 [Leucania separata nucleopolyhedrovirus]AAR28812.1 ORF48 [Leucania separata nucleopolyhedrovirus]
MNSNNNRTGSTRHVVDFYNGSRQAGKPTTLHNGNIPQHQYERVTQGRVSLMCYESMGRQPRHDNKENKYK